ncbi:hypothetical protein NP233_g6346 [Leucocoprinus birnbaumii]|uniref:Uncharacterized protein n=1 Tax=Leucocoprinus birnbaumii TaxID=56174 RepID=A0AAD5YTR6_9AGAR|nr:hypothetical protein NP233_g6346 [Leucocoprinus birnbaumii]
MQRCLDTFHAHKDIFIAHGAPAIRALGSPDGYNTESPERLHIDFAKAAYRASNRRDYVEQMAVWLQRRESMWIHEGYIQWLDNSLNQGETTGVLQDLDEDSVCVTPQLHTGAEPCNPGKSASLSLARSYRIAKNPAFADVSVETLGSAYQALDFTAALATFLRCCSGASHIAPNQYDRFDVYKQVIVTIPLSPLVDAHETTQRIRAQPASSGTGRKKGSPACFDTVLIVEDVAKFRSEGGLAGLRVAQVRVLFRLSPHLGMYPHPLAYVEWFTGLDNTPDPSSGLKTLRRSTRNSRRNVGNKVRLGHS